ncbi:unnamed protein product [Clonostachys rosea f. rosea IK726]|uniref:Uncharacterized protein n=1 Tax=Clonostachys rosea f. rosea IK726 TaxID=1349383 RepID=A0ACA9TFB7_BIOOC|nr:unnamed protein product [Clonostachys rosea f. rosea IK726]
MPPLPYSRRRSRRSESDCLDIEEPAPRRLRFSPPELTDVLFEVHSDFGVQSCQRRGALSAFLDKQNKPEPGHRAKHYAFSFDRFQSWAAQWVADLSVNQWVLSLDGSFFSFEEESSWQVALIGVNHLLEQADPRSCPRNPVVTIAPLPPHFLENSPCMTGGTHFSQQRKQLTMKEGETGASSSGKVTTSSGEESDSDSKSISSQKDIFSDEESGFGGNDSEVPESSDSENENVSDEGSEEDEEDEAESSSNPNKNGSPNLITNGSTIDKAQADIEQIDASHEEGSSLIDERNDHLQYPEGDVLSASPTTSTEDGNVRATSSNLIPAIVKSQVQTSTTTATTPSREEESNGVLEIDIDLSSNEEESSCDEEFDDDMEEECLGDERIAPAQQLLFKRPFLNQKSWAEVCTVLDHPIEKRDEGKLLLGTTQSLRIHQMAFIIRAMKAHRVAEELNGLLLADNVGLGKSICALGLFAVTSLALLNLRHARQYPEKHLPRDEKRRGLKCPSGNMYGIQCVCIPEGITHDYVQHLVYGPSVFAVPASNLDAWARRVSVYFKRTFRARGSAVDEELVEPLYYRETGQISPIPLEGKEKVVQRTDLVASPKVSSSQKRIAKKSRGEAKKSDSKPVTYQEACATYGNAGSLYFKAPRIGKAQFRYLILLSFTALGRQTSALARVFGVQTTLPNQQKTNVAVKGKEHPDSSISVIIPFAISVNLFFFDESHSVTSRDTQLFNSFEDIKRLSGISPRKQPKWYFMTATPFSHSPNDIHSCLRLLIGNRDVKKRILHELPNFATRFRRLQPKKSSGTKKQLANGDDTTTQFAQDFAKFVRPFTVARDWGSPYLDTCLHDIRPGIKHHVVEVSVPQGLAKAVERLGARCRKQLTVLRAEKRRDLHLEEVTGIKIFTQFFSASIAPGLAAILERENGHLLPTSVRRVDEDFRLGENGMLRKTLHFHRGHEWAEKLTEIIKTAHGGGKDQGHAKGDSTPNSEGPCHILLVAQTPVLVGLIVRFIEEDPELKNITRAKRIFQSVTPKPAGRDTLLRSIEKEAAESDRTYILVTTPRLIGVGVDIVFCSYVVQFGEIFSNREREQLIGRVNRPGQRLTVHHWHIKSTHHAHALVRERNNGRSVMLSEHGLVDEGVESEEVALGQEPEEAPLVNPLVIPLDEDEDEDELTQS